MSPDRELNAFLAGGEHQPRAGFSDAMVEAAAKAMFEIRPRRTDPKHWETEGDMPDPATVKAELEGSVE